MLRSRVLQVGVEGGVPLSVIHDSKYLAHRLRTLGQSEKTWKPSLLTDEEVQRLAISTHSPESYFNKKRGVTDPEWVVREDIEAKHSPTRYGDWEKNGRCIDF